MSGTVITYNGNLVYWNCKLQRIVSHSSAESELMGMDFSLMRGEYIRMLLMSLCGQVQKPIKMYVDCSSAIDIGTNPVQPGRNVHVHARYFYVRDLVEANIYEVCKIRSVDNVADIMATYKDRPNFIRHFRRLMTSMNLIFIEGKGYHWPDSTFE